MNRLLGNVARVVLAVVLAASTVAIAPTPTLAACNPGRANNGTYYFMGTSKTLSGITGVSSNIRTYSPYVSSNGFSYSWVMLPGPGNKQWAQIGPYKSATQLVTAVQVNNNFSSPIQWNFAATAVGSVHTYQVLRGAPGSYAMLIDGVIKVSYQLGYAAPGAQIYAEINTLATQLMGDSSTKESFASNRVRNSSGTWSTLSTSISPSTSHFGSSGSSGTTFYVWDKCV